jgi:GNAT superfamily N-acetyltransferase
MIAKMSTRPTFQPLTSANWDDFVQLFGPRGGCAGCWCMEPRQTRAEWQRLKGAGNKRAMRRLVQRGDEAPGILAYVAREPVGWISIEPRAAFSKLARSRVMAPVDTRAVWSIVCFFIDRRFRGRGLSVQLIRAAVKHARARGARIVEGYPSEPASGRMAPVFAHMGLAASYRRAGFKEVARRSATRPIMRRML